MNREELLMLVEHFRIKPSYYTANTINIILKNAGYKYIPKMSLKNGNIITIDNIDKYCDHIIKLIEDDNMEYNIDMNKSNQLQTTYFFEESKALPENIYNITEKNENIDEDDENLDNINAISDSEESGTDIEEELEDFDYGDDVYDDEDDFSD